MLSDLMSCSSEFGFGQSSESRETKELRFVRLFETPLFGERCRNPRYMSRASAATTSRVMRCAETTRGQRPQWCGTAAGEWNSSGGMKRVAGNSVDEAGTMNGVATPHKSRQVPDGTETQRTLWSARIATHPEPSGGANRRGGEKPRGRPIQCVWCAQSKVDLSTGRGHQTL